MNVVEWKRDWGATFQFVYVEEHRCAYCLSNWHNDGVTFYKCPANDDPGLDPIKFNALRWIDENVHGVRARAAWSALMLGGKP